MHKLENFNIAIHSNKNDNLNIIIEIYINYENRKICVGYSKIILNEIMSSIKDQNIQL
jgi:hypothetical protein